MDFPYIPPWQGEELVESQSSKDATIAAIALEDLRDRIRQQAPILAAVDRAIERAQTERSATALDRMFARIGRKRAMREEFVPVNQPRGRR